MATKNGFSWSASAASGSEPSEPSSVGPKAPPQQPATGGETTPPNANSPAEGGAENSHTPAMSTQPLPSERDLATGKLGRTLQAQLGRQLRAIFADVAEEPVPERFIKLLEEFEAREKRR
jgi:hypothetical protein